MAVNLTDLDIGTRYCLQEDLDNGFVGRDRQVVIQTDDPKGYRPLIMNGQGVKNKVALVDDIDDLSAGIEDLQDQISEKNIDYGTLGALPDNNVTNVSQLKVTDATLEPFAGTNGQIVYNTTTKHLVIMDGTTTGGAKVVANTEDIPESPDLSGYLTISEAASTYLTTNDASTTYIKRVGSAGNVANWENSVMQGQLTVENNTTGASATNGNITVNTGVFGESWTKSIYITTPSVQVTLGSSWFWVGGEAPEISSTGFLICHWNYDKGVAAFVTGAA